MNTAILKNITKSNSSLNKKRNFKKKKEVTETYFL